MKPSGFVKIAFLVTLTMNLLTMCLIIPSALTTSGSRLAENDSDAILPDVQQKMTSENQDVLGHFYENLGQIDNSEVLYYGHIPDGMIGFAEDKILLWLEGSKEGITLIFEDAKGVKPAGLNPSSQYTNYFLGDRGTFTDVRVYEGAIYRNLWSGIDLVYVGTERGAKYEFHVYPGSDPSLIKVHVIGHDALEINDESITIVSEKAVLTDNELLVFQDDITIDANFKHIDSNHYGFELGDFDTTKKLVIDPLLFSTYLGGSNEDVGFELVIDANDDIIMVGWTESSDFPFLAGYNETFGGFRDIFIAKFDRGGNILFVTYVGGINLDMATDVDVDPNNNIYVTGYSNSPDFPVTTGAFNESSNGAIDVVVLRFTPSGNTLVYSTFVGGSADDVAINLELKPIGIDGAHVFVTGFTESNDFPIVNGFKNPCSPGASDRDGFAFALNVNGDFIHWSFVMNGSLDDTAYAIELYTDPYDNEFLYIAGYTDSDNFPVTDGVVQPESTDQYDCFVMRINTFATTMYFSTYIGGNAIDRAFGMAIDYNGAVYIVGEAGAGFPTTPGVFGYTSSGGGGDTEDLGADGFVAKLSPQGTTLEFATYIGGSGDEQVTGILLDSQANILISGTTSSEDFPVMNAYDSSFNGGNTDCFISKISYDCTELLYSTYFGGSENDRMRIGCGFDSDMDLIFCGQTNSSDFPIMGNPPYDSSHNGDLDAFLARFSNDMISPIISSVERDILEPTEEDEVTISAIVTDNVDVDTVTLQHRNDENWVNVPMINILADNWTGVIPTYAVGNLVEYRIMATDTSNNEVYSSTRSYTTIPADNTGPNIVTSRDPSTEVTEVDSVVVTATITDDSGVAQAKLSYSVDGGSTWTNVTMAQEGVHWTAGISPQNVGVSVQYKVFAVDGEGNWAVSSTSTYTVISSLDVLQLVILLGQIGAAVGVFLAGLRYIRNRMKRTAVVDTA